MIGEVGADGMAGGAGDDGMLGDDGTLVGDVQDGSTARTLADNGKRVTATVGVKGTILWSAALINSSSGGNDSMTGGLGNDVLHGGWGDDVMNGDDPLLVGGGNDVLFGDWGNDKINGGAADDQLFGGSGSDNLDGGAGADLVYGGDGQDVLIADTKADRLVDWFGNFDQFIVPPPGFGAPTIIRSPDPSTQKFFLDLGAADGATDAQGEMVVVSPPSPGNTGPGTKA
jgi:Ca2+-binding RTX toxin-like protein